MLDQFWLSKEVWAALERICRRTSAAKTIYNRYARWARRCVWQHIFAKVAAAGSIPDELMLDSSHVEAHGSAAGGKGGSARRRSASRAAAEQQKSIVWPILAAASSPLP